MIKTNLYSSKGVNKGTFNLPRKYESEINMNLLAQALYVYHDRSHLGNSKVKTRGEVTASTRKIYRQKGTGGARHGDVKAPIFVGGGDAHGPKGVKRILSMPKNMRRKALNVALNLKSQEKKMIVVDSFKGVSKTNEANSLIDLVIKKELGKGKVKNILVVISEKSKDSIKYLKNLNNVKIVPFRNLNAMNVFKSNFLVLEKEVFDETAQTKLKVSNEKSESKTGKIKKAETKKKIQKTVKKTTKK